MKILESRLHRAFQERIIQKTIQLQKIFLQGDYKTYVTTIFN